MTRLPSFLGSSPLLMPLLMTAALTIAMTSPANALSTVTLPITVPLAGVEKAANARVPAEFAKVNETRDFLGGLVQVQLVGTVTRVAQVSVKPSADGKSLVVSVPIRAEFKATPTGMGALVKDFGGTATVSLTVQPYVTPDWEAGAKISSDYAWTDPLSIELSKGVKISVQSLVDSQVRAQLDKITADVEKAIKAGANLKARANTLWGSTKTTWTLPAPEPAYANLNNLKLSVTPFRFTSDALKLNLGATFELAANLGAMPQTQTTTPPLPPLSISALPNSSVDLRVPIRLPYPELSEVASKYAVGKTMTLPVPTSPTVKVLKVTVKPTGTQINAAVTVQINGPLGLTITATSDVKGTPTLDPTGRILTLKNVTVTTRREGLSGMVIGWLGDTRAQDYISRAAHFDLGPQLDKARAQIQTRLPYSPTKGVKLSGSVGRLGLQSFEVTPDALMVFTKASGNLSAALDIESLMH